MLRQTWEHRLVLPTVRSNTILLACWLCRRAIFRSSRVINILTSLLRQGSGHTYRRFLFGMSSSEPDISPRCPSDSGSDKDSSDDMYTTAIYSTYFSLSAWLMPVDSLSALAHFVFFCKKMKSKTWTDSKQVYQQSVILLLSLNLNNWLAEKWSKR